ncbi:MAG: hypothetical protein EBZ48_13180 [Proteobacteria bacterium]|nr:hypothetical protein [Pseudomonadota bacterium]
MSKHVFLPLLLSISLPIAANAQSALGVVCLSKNGKVLVRNKCLSGETTAALSDLAKKGATGDPGSSGDSGVPSRVVGFTNRGGQAVEQQGESFTESCSSGRIAVGGGCYSSNQLITVSRSYPFDGTPNGWVCQFKPRAASGSPQAQIITYAICVDP